MTVFSDPQVTQAMAKYFDHDLDPQYLYQGSHETIIEELKAWVIRRKEVYEEQMKLRDQSQKALKLYLESPLKAMEPGNVSITYSRYTRITVGIQLHPLSSV